MKLLTSPSLSSSTTSISYQSDVCTTKRPTISCLAGVLRRMLCTRSFPTQPSDQIVEEQNSAESDGGNDSRAQNHMDKGSSPGIVARMMGLESLPETNSTGDPTSVSRCRSMSSADHWPDGSDRVQNRHRGFKTSLSFREMPTHLELEDVEFFVLSFESGNGSNELWSKQWKSKEGKTYTCKTEDDSAAEKDHFRRLRPRPGNAMEVSEETRSVNITNVTKSRRKVKGNSEKIFRIKNADAEECSSEDASPVSVLDVGEWNGDPEEATTASDGSRIDDSYTRSRRKLSPELENTEHSVASGDGDSISDPRRPAAGGDNSFTLRSWKNFIHQEMWSEICKFAETEIMESKWLRGGTQQQLIDYEDMGVEVGLQVLNQLLDELVDQL